MQGQGRPCTIATFYGEISRNFKYLRVGGNTVWICRSERFSNWSLLCNQRSLSVPQFNYYSSIVSQTSIGGWKDIFLKPAYRHQLWFVYLIITCIIGLFDLLIFLVAAKMYKYRERNEGLSSQQFIEEVYDRDI